MIDRAAIEEAIHQNLCNGDFCVDRWADLLNISPSYLRIHVWQYYAISPHALIRKLRVQRALELFPLQPCIKIVSRSVGYVNERSFRNAFYKEYGMSPRQYLQRHGAGSLRKAVGA